MLVCSAPSSCAGMCEHPFSGAAGREEGELGALLAQLCFYMAIAARPSVAYEFFDFLYVCFVISSDPV